MDRAKLDAFLAARGYTVQGDHDGAGKFKDLYIGIGRAVVSLCRLRDELKAAGIPDVIVTQVTNPDHADHGKSMVEIRSYWNE